ncbi:MAG: tRNA-dihydrouridine synthase [Thermoguttaceae bacterium]|nr:tRNA-dihydrouridine synthase [Thermoguttaceae bacterium]
MKQIKPLKLGSWRFDFPVIQAALSGYSDAPMRRLAKEFGASLTLCEVFLDQFVLNVSKRSKAKLYLAVRDSDHPCGAQLMGSRPEEFVLAAKRLLDFGFDLIDLNFACPVKKVLGRCRGGYLLSDPEQAMNIAKAVRNAVPDTVPLTVKLRKGFDDSPESQVHFRQILDGVVDLGFSGMTLHGRTVRQRYEGTADWDFVASVKRYLVEEKKMPQFPVIGSGDLFDPQTCLNRMIQTSVDGLALARGIIGNPWLFRQTRALFEGKELPPKPDLEEQKSVIEAHYNEVVELYGEKRASTVLRKFAIQYAALHPESEKVRMAFVMCHNRKDWLQTLDKYYHGSRVNAERSET